MSHHDNSHLIKGLAAGGLIGAGLVFLFATKKGARLREDFRNACHDLSDKASELTEQAADLKEELSERGEELYEKALNSWSHKSKKGEINSSTILTGAIAGSVLGAVAVYLLSKDSEASQFAKKTSAAAKTWIDKARDIIENVDEARERGEKIASDESNVINDVIQLASVGLKLYHSIKEGR